MAFLNQKVIRIIKTTSNKENPYGIFNKRALFAAMGSLSPTAFKVWCYLNCNQNEYELELSSLDVRPKCNIGRATYYDAVNELIDKGFLIEVELRENKRGYLFLETADITLAGRGEKTR